MTIEERLERLERSNHRYRVALIAGLALSACHGITANYDKVSVRELVIVDADEKPVATFIGRSTRGELSFRQKDGSSRVLLSTDGIAQKP
jgi:hypothetical protein